MRREKKAKEKAMTELQMILFLCPIFFLTSFMDAVSGGGLVASSAICSPAFPHIMPMPATRWAAWWEILFPSSVF